MELGFFIPNVLSRKLCVLWHTHRWSKQSGIAEVGGISFSHDRHMRLGNYMWMCQMLALNNYDKLLGGLISPFLHLHPRRKYYDAEIVGVKVQIAGFRLFLFDNLLPCSVDFFTVHLESCHLFLNEDSVVLVSSFTEALTAHINELCSFVRVLCSTGSRLLHRTSPCDK